MDSEQPSVQKLFACKCCGQMVMITYTPNELIGEEFIAALFTCDDCLSKRNPRFKAPVRAQAPLPYKDT